MAVAEATPRRRRFRLLVPLLLLLVLVGGATTGAYFLGFLEPVEKYVAEFLGTEEESPLLEVNSFVNFDEIVVNLPRDGGKQKFLKVSISLELRSEEDAARVKILEPRIRDSYEAFLRELQVREIEGSRGIYRVKEELLARTNLLVAPIRVKNVLFRDLLIQ